MLQYSRPLLAAHSLFEILDDLLHNKISSFIAQVIVIKIQWCAVDLRDASIGNKCIAEDVAGLDSDHSRLAGDRVQHGYDE